jgi:hypothetical protein
MIQFKLLFRSALLLSALSLPVLFSGCDRDDDDDTPTNYTLSGNASAANEFPALSTTTYPGTGTITGTYNPNSKLLTYTISWTGLSGAPTAAHFHGPALPGANASPVVTLALNGAGATGTLSGSTTLDATQEADLLAGKWYYNLHTVARGPGEIRGQVAATR